MAGKQKDGTITMNYIAFLLRYSVISYDRAGRLISITDQEGAVTSYQYDTQGNMTAVM